MQIRSVRAEMDFDWMVEEEEGENYKLLCVLHGNRIIELYSRQVVVLMTCETWCGGAVLLLWLHCIVLVRINHSNCRLKC